MNFKKRGELKKLFIIAMAMLFCFAVYMVFAQESTTIPNSETTSSETATSETTSPTEEASTITSTETSSSTSATPTTPSITLVAINDPTDRDYEGYQVLDMDSDSYLTEEDAYLMLEEINNQVSGANTYITYLREVHGLSFTLTPITTDTSIKDSATVEQLNTNLETTGQELENLAVEIDLIQNQAGALANQDPNIIPILGYFHSLDYDIYLVMWYTGRG